jgi:hypothetical protein
MATRQQSLIVGIFEDRTRADQALAALQQAGFRPDQIEFAQHGATSGTGLLAELKSLFAGHDRQGTGSTLIWSAWGCLTRTHAPMSASMRLVAA